MRAANREIKTGLVVAKINWLNKKIRESSDHILLGGILLICLIYRLFYFGLLRPNMILYNSDSVSYFADVKIFSGAVDLYHTPVYPCVIKLFEYISKDNLVQNLICFQQIISFLSVIPFYFVSKSIIRNKYLMIIATLFYGCWNYIIIWNVHINPESLCFAGSTLMMFMLVKYLERPTKLNTVSIGILPLFLTMLKPTYLILICVVLLFFIFRFIVFCEERKILYWGFLGLFITVTGVLGYCELNKKSNGQFVLSNIYLNNSLAHIAASGAYRQGGDEEFIAIIDGTRHEGYYKSTFLINNHVVDNYPYYYNRFPQYLPPTDDMLFCLSIPHTAYHSPERINQFVKKSQCTTIYFKYMLQRAVDIILAYGNLFVLFMLQSLIITYAFVKHNKIAWAQSFFILFVLGQFLTITIGGLDDIDRCLIPAYPFIMQIAASFTAIIISFLKRKELMEFI